MFYTAEFVKVRGDHERGAVGTTASTQHPRLRLDH